MAIRVTVVYSPAPRQVQQWPLQLPDGATAADALRASGCASEFEALRQQPPVLGIWGRKVAADQALRDQDRLEIYRPLKVDPKVARRERFSRQGSKTAGLFTRSPAGGKKKAG